MPRSRAVPKPIPVLAAALAFFAGVAGSQTSAALFAHMSEAIAAADSDGNGILDQAEWRTAGLRSFIAVDQDGDGTISLAEFALFHGALFAAVDTNHDGQMTADEAEAYNRLPWTLTFAR